MRQHADFIKKFTASYRAYEGEDIVPWQVLIGNVAAVSLVISVWMHLHYKLYRLSKVQAKLGFGSRTGDHGDRRDPSSTSRNRSSKGMAGNAGS
ncbi:hypothetical protein V7796_19940 [Rhizobium laguerreae]